MQRGRSGRFTRRSFLAGTGAVAAGVSFGPHLAWSAEEEKKLNFYNWDTYIGETTLDDFEEETGVEVKMDLFADNNELFAKLKEGNPGYDLIVPTNDYVRAYDRRPRCWYALDHAARSPISRPTKSRPVPGRRTSTRAASSACLTCGARSASATENPRMDGVPDSWKWLYDSDKYSGEDRDIGRLPDAAWRSESALKYLGHIPSTPTDPADDQGRPKQLVIRQKPHIKVFAADNGQDLLLSGEVDHHHGMERRYPSGDGRGRRHRLRRAERGRRVLWQDVPVPFRRARRIRNNAHMSSSTTSIDAGSQCAAIADFIQYATPNAAAARS